MDYKFIPQNGRIVAQATEILVGSEIKARQAGEVIHKQYLNKPSKRATRAIPEILQSDGTLKFTTDTPFGKCYIVNSYSTQTSTREPYRKNSSDIDGVNQFFSGQSYKKRHTGDITLDGERVTGVYIIPKPVYMKSVEQTGAISTAERTAEYESFLKKLAEFKENLGVINEANRNEAWIDFFKPYENKIFYKFKENTTIPTVWYKAQLNEHDDIEIPERFLGIGTFDDFAEIDTGRDGNSDLYQQRAMSGAIYEKVVFAYVLNLQGGARTERTSESIKNTDKIDDLTETINGELKEIIITETDPNEPQNIKLKDRIFGNSINEFYKSQYLFLGEADPKGEAEKKFGKTIQGCEIFTHGAITKKGFIVKEKAIYGYDSRFDSDSGSSSSLSSQYISRKEYVFQPLFHYGTDNPICKWYYLLEIWNDIYKFNITRSKSWLSSHLGFVKFVIMIVAMALAVWTGGQSVTAANSALATLQAVAGYTGALALAFTGMGLGNDIGFFKKASAIFGAISTIAGIGAIAQNIGQRAAEQAGRQVAQESAKNFSNQMAQKTATSLFDKFMNSTIIQYVKMGFKAFSAINDIMSAFRGGDLPQNGEKAQTQQEIDNENKKKFVDTTLPDEILQDGKPKLLSDKWLPADRLDLWNG